MLVRVPVVKREPPRTVAPVVLAMVEVVVVVKFSWNQLIVGFDYPYFRFFTQAAMILVPINALQVEMAPLALFTSSGEQTSRQ